MSSLEVGTETLLDKSKSTKSVLMQIFGENYDIEGVDTINSSYSGTNPLFNSVDRVEPSSWNECSAIVVAAMIIGPDSLIAFDSVHGSHMEHSYDFYKPYFTSEYPVVDGHFYLTCFARALDQAYQTYIKKCF